MRRYKLYLGSGVLFVGGLVGAIALASSVATAGGTHTYPTTGTTETTTTETTPPAPRCPEGQVPIGGKDGDESEPHHNQECCYDVNLNGVCDDSEQPPTTTSRETTPAVSPPPDTTTGATTETQPTETVPPEETSPPTDTSTTPASPPPAVVPPKHETKPPKISVRTHTELPRTGSPLLLAAVLGFGLLTTGSAFCLGVPVLAAWGKLRLWRWLAERENGSHAR